MAMGRGTCGSTDTTSNQVRFQSPSLQPQVRQSRLFSKLRLATPSLKALKLLVFCRHRHESSSVVDQQAIGRKRTPGFCGRTYDAVHGQHLKATFHIEHALTESLCSILLCLSGRVLEEAMPANFEVLHISACCTRLELGVSLQIVKQPFTFDVGLSCPAVLQILTDYMTGQFPADYNAATRPHVLLRVELHDVTCMEGMSLLNGYAVNSAGGEQSSCLSLSALPKCLQ